MVKGIDWQGQMLFSEVFAKGDLTLERAAPGRSVWQFSKFAAPRVMAEQV
jgi:hypothetical protein